MDLARSPLALPFPDMPIIDGVDLRVARARYKNWDRADLTFVEMCKGTAVAGVFTQSACASSEVEMGREQVKSGSARALVVNAGNSNAFTGHRGREAVEQIMEQVAGHIGCDTREVFVSSTGVIGVPLPKDKARQGIENAINAEYCGWREAADAIGTTDTFPKGAHVSAMIGNARVDLVGIIKGSGMIAPDMATMLGYIFTDARVAPAFLQEMLSRANAETFSCITVDGDTSTSDTVLAFATGTTHAPLIEGWDSPGADAFAAALTDLCRQLAQAVVRDGEGASKFITIRVSGAASDESARRVGLSIANSPLVKTAIAGEDANWGRVVMAVGKAGEPADRDRLSIAFGGVWAARDGVPVEDYDEAPVAAHLKGEEIDLAVDLGIGEGSATVWTCDLTHGYIAINADYRS
jgi:glutamate N-acetyltransferase/amino-acid N-acetyltransferase